MADVVNYVLIVAGSDAFLQELGDGLGHCKAEKSSAVGMKNRFSRNMPDLFGGFLYGDQVNRTRKRKGERIELSAKLLALTFVKMVKFAAYT